MNTDTLHPYVQTVITNIPRAGEGVNNWLYRVARLLHASHGPQDIFAFLKSSTNSCGRAVSDYEISRAITNSAATAPTINGQKCDLPKGRYLPKPWPNLNRERRAAIMKDGFCLADLCDKSPPLLCENSEPDMVVDIVLDLLFPSDDPWICCGKSKSVFQTIRRRLWRSSFDCMQLVVPSPMSRKYGITKEGKRSQHSLDNTGPRRFLVIEQDIGTLDEQAAIIWHLAQTGPLALVIHSGSKSLHAWFYCAGKSDAFLRPFFAEAISLGADRATWLRSQFVRLPGAVRDNGARQSVLYLDVAALDS